MRLRLLSLTVRLFISVLAFLSCERSVEPEPPDPLKDLKEQLSHSPRADREAELMALWLGGEVVAHDTLYEKLKNAAALVRNTFRDIVPYLDSMEFGYYYRDSYLEILMSPDSVEALHSGTYHEWDQLNELYRIADIDTTLLSQNRVVVLTFEGRLSPLFLGSLYMKLRGTGWMILSPIRFGDYGNFYPWITDDGCRFLLRKAWRDCNVECRANHFWYFGVTESGAEYYGDVLEEDYPAQWPDWWAEAKVAMDAWKSQVSCWLSEIE